MLLHLPLYLLNAVWLDFHLDHKMWLSCLHLAPVVTCLCGPGSLTLLAWAPWTWLIIVQLQPVELHVSLVFIFLRMLSPFFVFM